ncbi:hypothetical protein, partial [Anaerotignum lactatifermentans]|uniref:hypothetical protein n=1 Tax=Anaerotignum lactatifermentans TaxID=160404 RepID=UPI003AB20DED
RHLAVLTFRLEHLLHPFLCVLPEKTMGKTLLRYFINKHSWNPPTKRIPAFFYGNDFLLRAAKKAFFPVPRLFSLPFSLLLYTMKEKDVIGICILRKGEIYDNRFDHRQYPQIAVEFFHSHAYQRGFSADV